jgi:hypothetical protein
MDGVKYALGFPDAAGSPRRFGPDRDRKQSLEENVAFDAETERKPDRDHFGEAE